MRTRVVFAIASLAIVSVAIACSEAYAPGDTPSPGEPDASSVPFEGGEPDSDDPVDASVDAAPALGTPTTSCPRPLAPTRPLASCEHRPLYVPASPTGEFPFGIATDSAFVYWIATKNQLVGDIAYDGLGTARIMRVDRRGSALGATANVLVEGQRESTELVVAGEWLYWNAYNGAAHELRRARRDCASGCAAIPLASFGGSRISRLAVIDSETLVVHQLNGVVSLVKVTATGATTSTAGTTSAFPGTATTATEAFGSGALTSIVTRITPAGGAMTGASAAPLATLPDAGPGQNAGLSPLTTDCARLYGWRGGGRFWRVAIDGGAITSFDVPAWGSVFDLATDRDWLYAALADGPGLFAIPLNGASPTSIQPGNIWRIAVDDVGVYWADHDKVASGTLWMMVK